MIGLVDGNNFFVSCERIFDRSLEGKPVGILSNNDGCVVSRSNEMKALGIKMGTPFFELRPNIARLGLVLRSSNFELYGDISNRVMSVLAEFAPAVEQYSIDEAFIRPEGVSDYLAFGSKLRSTILKWIGVPCGVGFAPTKTLAKIANHIGKKLASGVFVMPENTQPILSQLEVSEVWGVGRRLAPRLHQKGIETAWDLANYGDDKLQKSFSIILARTAMELRGTECLTDEHYREQSQSIGVSRSFGKPVTEFDHLAESVCHYLGRAAEKLRAEGQRAAGANAYFIYYPEYRPRRLDGGCTSCTVAFPYPTDDTSVMLSAITPKLRQIFVGGRRYKKSGVLLWGLESGAVQTDLFTKTPVGNSKLFAAIDKINAKFGRGSVAPLAEGIEKPWRMKSESRSPRYTTVWDEIPTAK